MLHPSLALGVWLLAVLLIQGLGEWPLLGLLAAVLLWPGVLVQLGRYLRRAKILLLSLWLILAYHTPGEAWGDWAWAPTHEGMAEASLHALRLVVMLACLAWLMVTQGRDGLIAGLWGWMQPLRRWGIHSDRAVIRLSLVLEQLQQPLPKGAWRALLMEGALPASATAVVIMQQPAWCTRDRVVAALALGLAVGSLAW